MLKKNPIYRNVFLVILSAVLTNLAFPEIDFFWIHFISLIPFLYVLINEKKLLHSVLYTVLFGIVFKGILLFWLKIFHPLSLPGILLGFLVYFSLLGLICYVLLQAFPRFRFFIIPSAWLSIEYIRSIGFLGFPWGLVSHSQWNFLPFIQIADIFGMWIITFLVVLINMIFLEIILNVKNKTRLKSLISAFLVLFFVPLFYGFIRIHHFKNRMKQGEQIKVALIQPHIDPNLSWKKVRYKALSKLTILSERANLSDPDLIAWSETAILDYIKYYKDNYNRLKRYPTFFEKLQYTDNVFRLARDLNNYIFTGIPDHKKVIKDNKAIDEDYNGAILINPKGETVDTYYKIHLVPFGEWFPFRIGFINKILAQTWAGDWTPGERYTVFRIKKKNKKFAFSCLICYEGIFGDLCRRFVQNGAEFLLNITNDTWSFKRKAEIQHMIADTFRSIENRVPYVRSANSGVTCVINQYGKVESQLPLFKQGFLLGEIYIDKKRKTTLYNMYGDFLPKFLLIFNLGLLVYAVYSRFVLKRIQ